MGPTQNVRQLLMNNRVLEITKSGQQVAVLKDTATVEQALRVLAELRIISAPVVVTPEGDPHPDDPLMSPCTAGDILGFVDIRDILNSFLADIDLSALNEVKLLQRMRVLEEKGALFGEKKLKELEYLGTDGDFIHASQARSTVLELVLNGLLQPRHTRCGHHGNVVHRIALFDDTGCITQIISQSDVIKFLARHSSQLGAMGGQSIEDLGLMSWRVEGVHPETPAIEAMAVMSQKRLSSLAVLDPNGALLGNFSMSDLRTIVSEHFGALALPVGEYLAQEHHTEFVAFNRLHEEGVEGTAGHKFVSDKVARRRSNTPGNEVGQSLVLARGTDTLVQVIEKLVKNRIHRLYIIDDKDKPCGIITCTDILRKLLEEAC